MINMGKTMNMIKREKMLKEIETNNHNQHIPAIEIVGETCAKPAKKWKVKRSSSSKGIEIIWDEK